jgi:hypothetical protein
MTFIGHDGRLKRNARHRRRRRGTRRLHGRNHRRPAEPGHCSATRRHEERCNAAHCFAVPERCSAEPAGYSAVLQANCTGARERCSHATPERYNRATPERYNEVQWMPNVHRCSPRYSSPSSAKSFLVSLRRKPPKPSLVAHQSCATRSAHGYC